jgi:acyl-CoA thioester hydrolase
LGENIKLISTTETTIRFSEVDSMAVVWHGHYAKYLEDGREAFGKKYGLGYLDVYRHGIMTPLVELNLNYKNYLNYGDVIIIETEFIDTPAAKIQFDYTIYKKSDRSIVLKAKSIQVFVETDGTLLLTNPAFFSQWKAENGIIQNEL